MKYPKTISVSTALYLLVILFLATTQDHHQLWHWAIAALVTIPLPVLFLSRDSITGPEKITFSGTWFGVRKGHEDV